MCGVWCGVVWCGVARSLAQCSSVKTRVSAAYVPYAPCNYVAPSFEAPSNFEIKANRVCVCACAIKRSCLWGVGRVLTASD